MKPKIKHWKSTKGLLRYLKGSMDVGLVYYQYSNLNLISRFTYVDDFS